MVMTLYCVCLFFFYKFVNMTRLLDSIIEIINEKLLKIIVELIKINKKKSVKRH